MSSLPSLLNMPVLVQVARGFLASISQWVPSLERKKHAMLAEVIGMMADKIDGSPSGKTFETSEAAEAVQEAQRQGRGGRVFLTG